MSSTDPEPHRRRAAVPAALALLLAVLLMLLGTAPAQAHARLLSSNPADGSTVRALPETLELVFNEDIDATLAQVVIEASQGVVGHDPPQVRGPAVDVPLPDTLPPGQVTVRYRVVSADGHPISGQISFTYTSSTAGLSPPPPGGAGTPGAAPAGAASAPADAEAPSTSNPMMSVLTGVAVLVLAGLALLFFRWNRSHR